ncbi:MAG: polysaccharide deacetylase family protein [Victivallaceae bacterium]
MKIFHKIKRFKQFTLNILGNCVEAPVIVLLYHRVCEIKNDYQQLAVSPENFDAQIDFLNRNYPVLRFEDDWGKAKKTSFCITFDDGYADNLHNALPVLNKYSVPATFFIASGNIQSGGEFWWDQIEQILSKTKIKFDKLNLSIPPTVPKEEAVVQIQLALKSFSVQERRKFIGQLVKQAQVELNTRTQYRPLTIEELKQLSENELVTIGSHTVNHPRLAELPQSDQEYEINTGKAELEAILGNPVDTFSYPFGNLDDFSDITMKICKLANINKAAANFPGQTHSWTAPYQIPRSLVRNWDIDEFKKQVFRFKYL